MKPKMGRELKKARWIALALAAAIALSHVAFAATYQSVSDVFYGFNWDGVWFQVRSCGDPSCSGEAFTGPDNTSGSWFAWPGSSLDLTRTNLSEKRYFQFRANLTTDNNTRTPKLYGFAVEYYNETGVSVPVISPLAGATLSMQLTCSATGYRVGGGALNLTFRWFNGSSFYGETNVSSSDLIEKTSSLLPKGVQAYGETWGCSVRPYVNSTVYSDWRSSSVVIADPVVYEGVDDVFYDFRYDVPPIRLQVRSCQQAGCGDAPSFMGPDNTSGSWFANSSFNDLLGTSLPYGRYFQFKALLSSGGSTTPQLFNFSLGYEPILSSVSNNAPNPIKGGNSFNITPSSQNDSNSFGLYFFCRLDSPGADSTNTACSQGSAMYSYPYANMSCTVSAPSDTANHTYYCRVYDNASYSAERATSITTDSSPPNPGSISVTSTGDSGYVNSTTPVFSLSTSDVGSAGMWQMEFSCDNSTWASPLSYAASYSAFNVKSGSNGCGAVDGSRAVYVRFRDSVGNVQNATVNTSFVLDTSPPATGSISITPTGATGFVNTTTPTLSLSSSDSNLGYMQFSCNNVSYSSFVSYAGSYSSFNLNSGEGCAAGDGSKTVYVRFKDRAGNVQPTVNSSGVVLDTTLPALSFVLPSDANNSVIGSGVRNWSFVNVSVTEQNLDKVKLYWNGSGELLSCSGSAPNWTCAVNKTDLNLGTYSYYAWANDSAGNVLQGGGARVLNVRTLAFDRFNVSDRDGQLNGILNPGERYNLTVRIQETNGTQNYTVSSGSFNVTVNGTNYPLAYTGSGSVWRTQVTYGVAFSALGLYSFLANASGTSGNGIVGLQADANYSYSVKTIQIVNFVGWAGNVSGYANVTFTGVATLLPDNVPVASNFINVYLGGQFLNGTGKYCADGSLSQSCGWQYRKPITINGSASALTDYQVFVNLTSSNFDFSRANSQGNDTRFTWLNTSSGLEQSISFWIENWTASGAQGNASLWVRVPSLPANGTATLYLYYGNPDANSTGNGSATFLFFDDFSGDLGRWSVTQSTAGNVQIVNGEVRMYGNGAWGTNGMLSVSSFTKPFVLEATNTRVTGATNPYFFMGVMGTLGNPYVDNGLSLYYGNDASIPQRHRFRDTSDLTLEQYVVGANYSLKFIIKNSGYALYRDGASLEDDTTWSQGASTKIVFSKHSTDGYGYADNVRVRKYSSPEPSVLSMGAEQVAVATNSSGGYSYTLPSLSVGFQSLRVNLTDPNGIYGESVASNNYLLKSYSGGSPESFFAQNESVELRAFGNFDSAPLVSIVDPSGVWRVSFVPMVNVSGAFWAYNYSVNGSAGWWNVSVNSRVFAGAFYVGQVWPAAWLDNNGKTYPFRLQFNVSEPDSIERFFEPVDLRVNFAYGAHNNSVRVLQWNGSRLLEVPSQLYALNQSGMRVNSASLVFLSALGRNSTKRYYAYYSRSDFGAPNYSSVLSVSNRTSFFEFENANFRVLLNNSRGGVMESTFNRLGDGQNLRGSSPMQVSPVVLIGINSYPASSVQNPSVSIERGGLRSVYSVRGTVDLFDYALKYTFFSQAPYFLVEVNTTSKMEGNWNSLKSHYLYFGDGVFSSLSYRNSTGIFAQQVPAGNGPDPAFGDLGWLGFYSNNTGNSFGDVFLSASPAPQGIYFYNELSSDYYDYTQYSGSVSVGSNFYSRVARVLWRGFGDFQILNDTYARLSNPVSFSLGASETSDSVPPRFSVFNQAPFSPADTDNLTCFSYWSDNLELDYALVRVNSSNYNAESQLSIRANESWVNVSVPASLLEAGRVVCNVTVFDLAGLSNSTQWNFSVSDNSSPVISALSYFPSSAAGLDPNVSVVVSVNLTEYSGVSSVVLQYRNGTSGWANVSMGGANVSAFYYSYSANFTPDSEGVWFFRVFVNDSIGNFRYGNETNVSVYYDWTWELSPADFGIKQVLLGGNATIGGLVVNNTGDIPLSFRVSSNWDSNRIFFNNTVQGSGYYFVLQPKNVSRFNVTVAAVATTERSDSLSITVAALNASSQPDAATSNATIVSYAGGPFLLVSMVQYNSTATVGDSGLFFNAKVQNKGNESASGVFLRWALPSGWSADRNLSAYVGSFAVDAVAWSNVTVNIAGSASAGAQVVYLYANSSENKTGVASAAVAVAGLPSQTTVVQPGSQGTGFVTKGDVVVSNASLVWSGGLTREQRQELFRTSERFELVRGRDSSFPLVLKNPLDGVLENVSFSVSGYLSRYIRIVPGRLDSLGPNESFSFSVLIEAPKYFNTGRYDLDFVIRGVVTQLLRSGNRSVVRVTSLEEERSVALFVHDLDRVDAVSLLNESVAVLSGMKEEGLAVRGLAELVEQAGVKLNAGDYEAVRDIVSQVSERREQALFVKQELASLDSAVGAVSRRGVSTPDTLRLLNLARAGFARGDFAAAKARLEEARLTLALESKGEFNAWFFVRDNPRLFFGGLLGLFVLYFLVVLNVRFAVLSGDIKSLRREEVILVGLMREVQRECFDEKKLSMEEYDEAMLQYENKLSSVVHKLIESEALRANVFKFGGRERSLLVERGRLLEEIKRTQRDYMERGAIETHSYELRMRTFVGRLSEVEDKVASLEADRFLRRQGFFGRVWGLFVRGG